MDDSGSNTRDNPRHSINGELLSSGNDSIKNSSHHLGDNRIKEDDIEMPTSAAAFGSCVDNVAADQAPLSSLFNDESAPVTTKLTSRLEIDGQEHLDDGYYLTEEAVTSETYKEDEDRKLSSSLLHTHQHQSATPTRGRPLRRDHDINNIGLHVPTPDNGFVPLKVIHVPNKRRHSALLDATKRAPSVPDLTSLHYYQNHNEYRHHPRSNTPPPLSDVVLKIKEQGDQKQQFEERLRRAHLRLSSDDNVVRYRSKSTPSRGGAGGSGIMLREDFNNYPNRDHSDRRRKSDFHYNHEADDSGQHDDFRNEANRIEQLSPAPPVEEVKVQNIHRSTADSIHNMDSQNEIIPPPQSLKSSGISVAAGSHLSHGSSFENKNRTIPEPPPPPPPTTERERLVERERQARLETERARRRHIALQRERHLDEHSDDNNLGISFDNEGSSVHDALIGQISFEEDDNGIPSPPIPPPPATEKERLVERERQARLETERARRRHLAIQREQQLEMDGHSVGDDIESHDYHSTTRDDRSNDNLNESMLVQAIPESFVSPIAALRDEHAGNREATTESVISSVAEHDNGENVNAQNNDAEATSLSYPMERFLETLADEPDVPPVESDEASLPYTMELFLAENVVDMSGDDNQHLEIESSMEHHGNSVSSSPPNSEDIPHPPLSTLLMGEVNERVVSENVVPSAFDEAIPLSSERPADSNITDRSSLDNHESFTVPEQHFSSDLRDLELPSQQSDNYTFISPDLGAMPSRPITEADIAHLAEVEHASIGNAAPQSERDEPSETSIPRRPLDQAFSVATQTTIIDSVTETSVGRSHLMSDANQSRGSSNIIRVGGSVETVSSGGASSASIEAVPSNISNDDSDHDSHLIMHAPSMRSDSHGLSLADGSNLSSDANFRMPELTEADVVALAEIDYASIGNAPPLSVRDERLSESSVTERGGRQFSVATPISEMESIDENSILRGSSFRSIINEDSESNISITDDDSRMSSEVENTSVEVMPSDRSDNTDSHNSIELMLSEQGDDYLFDGGRVTDIDHLASSMSNEASSSVNLETNLDMAGSNHRLAMYATMDAEDGTDYHSASVSRISSVRDEESAPLIPSQLSSPDKLCRGGKI